MRPGARDARQQRRGPLHLAQSSGEALRKQPRACQRWRQNGRSLQVPLRPPRAHAGSRRPRQGARDHRFSLNFVALSTFLPRVLELFNTSKMPIAQRETQWRNKLLDMQRNTKFDPSWLVDLHEHMLLEMAGAPCLASRTRVAASPGQREPARSPDTRVAARAAGGRGGGGHRQGRASRRSFTTPDAS